MTVDHNRRDIDPTTDDVIETTICGACGEEGHFAATCPLAASEAGA